MSLHVECRAHLVKANQHEKMCRLGDQTRQISPLDGHPVVSTYA